MATATRAGRGQGQHEETVVVGGTIGTVAVEVGGGRDGWRCFFLLGHGYGSQSPTVTPTRPRQQRHGERATARWARRDNGTGSGATSRSHGSTE